MSRGIRTISKVLSLAATGATLLSFASPALGAKSTVATLGGTSSGNTGGQFFTPRGIAVNTSGEGGVPVGTFYVVDGNNRRIQRFSPEGAFVSAWGIDVVRVGSSNDLGAHAFEKCDTTAAIPNSEPDCKEGSSSVEDPSNPDPFKAGALNNSQGIAIDQNTGVVYVSDQATRRINAYSATGAFEGAFGWGARDGTATFQFCVFICSTPGPTAPASGNVPGGQFGAQLGGLAVDSSGRIYVANKTSRRVDIFTPIITKGAIIGVAFTRAFGWDVANTGDSGDTAPTNGFEVCTTVCKAPGAAGAQAGNFATNSPIDLALDVAGNVYALDAPLPNRRVQKFDAAPAPVPAPAFDASPAISTAFGLTGALYGLDVDDDASRLYVAGSDSSSVPGNQVRVGEMDLTGLAIPGGIHGTDLTITTALGLAVAPASAGGNLFLSSTSGGHRVFVLNTPPTAALDAISIHTDTTATFSGVVDPMGSSVTCVFQYLDGSKWTDLPDPDCAALIPGGGPQAIAEDVTGLQPNRLHQVRLVAAKAFGGGSFTTGDKSFTTDSASPTVSQTATSEITDTAVTLSGEVNPNSQATTYRFEYVDDATFQSDVVTLGAGHGFDHATSVPAADTPIGAGGTPVVVRERITDLAPTTVYHHRLIATNDTGVTEGDEGPEFTTYAQPSVDACVNDEFRAGVGSSLPNCRAYEQASPVDKNGLDLSGTVPTVKAAIDGGAVSFTGTSGIPGGKGAQEIPLYLASRGAADWSTQGILPPQTPSERAHVDGWTTDFSQVFDWTRGPAGMALLARSSADGSLRTIAPLNSIGTDVSINFVGASTDGSQVFFESDLQYTPEAAFGEENLYVWDSDSETVKLAGILPDGSTPPGGSFAGPYDWVDGTDSSSLSRGGAARGYYTQDLHAISIEGDRAFFTTGDTGGLFLRQDPSSASASTTRINASQKTNGLGLGGTDPGGAKPAAFMASTPNGSRSFFTSSEKLTNDANTGPELTPAAIARSDLDGGNGDPTFLLADASGVTVDSAHMYWIDPKAETIGRATLDGTTEVDRDFIELPELEIGPDEFASGNPKDVAVGGSHIYWTNATDGALGTGTIGRADLNGDNVDQSFIAGASAPRGLDVDANHVYWANTGLGPLGFVGRATLDGTTEVNHEFVQVANGDVTINDSHIFRTFYNRVSDESSIERTKLDGTDSEFLFATFNTEVAPELALDNTHVYWGNRGEGVIGRANLDGTAQEPEFIQGAGTPEGLAVGAAHIYWSANQGESFNPGRDLYRYDTETGELVDVAPDDTSTKGAEVRGVLGASADGALVYFVANGILSSIPNAEGETAELGDCPEVVGEASGTCNLYLARESSEDEFTIEFITRLSHANSEGVTDAANWTGSVGGVGQSITRSQKTARVSTDGSTLLFRSHRKLTEYDNEGMARLYRFKLGEPELRCVSCSPVGAAPSNVPATGILPTSPQIPGNPAAVLSRTLSSSGERVFFESTDALVSEDRNGEEGCPKIGNVEQGFPACQDVYQWEAQGSGSCGADAHAGGCLSLISTGQSSSPSFLIDASESGSDVFFFTRSALVGQDEDDIVDVYDARIGGGLASQNRPPDIPCEGETCKGGSALPPGVQSPGSSSFAGPGNIKQGRKPGRRCPKGKHRVKKAKGKGRCVTKRQGRAANMTGRAGR